MAEGRRGRWAIRAGFAVAFVSLAAVGAASAGGVSYAWNAQATGTFHAKVGTWATSACPLADFSYPTGAQTYPMVSVTVSANATLPTDCALSFSLNSYTTQGPDWPSTGTQALYDHQTMTLDAANRSGTLAVRKPPCYGQTDFYTGTTAFDGTDGPLPSYPDDVVPQPLIAWS
ncbi:MAG: hypothetical protein P4L84_01635, partial [Isosphaeraceae bacterium]|nr:hypothetical protein [Isosphaeraceae bacterium]